MRDTLIKIYLSYKNDYLTVEKFAEHGGLTVNQALRLIELAREVFNDEHPEA